MALAQLRHADFNESEAHMREKPLSKLSFPLPADAQSKSTPATPFVATTERLNDGYVECADSGGPSNHEVFSATLHAGKAREHMDKSSDTTIPPSNLTASAIENLLRSLQAMQAPRGPSQPKGSSMSPGQLRDILLPLMVENAQRRPGFDDGLASKVEDKLREALTDQFCGTLAEKMQSVHRQLHAMRSNAIEKQPVVPHQILNSVNDAHVAAASLSTSLRLQSSNGDIAPPTPPVSARLHEPPKAPRAMRLEHHSESRPSSDSAISAQGRSTDVTFDVSRGRSRGRIDPDTSSSAPTKPYGIPIPLDLSFFAAPPTSTVKRESPTPSEYGKSLHTRSNRSRSPHHRSLLNNRRRSRSPDQTRAYSPPAKHRRRSLSRPRSSDPASSNSWRRTKDFSGRLPARRQRSRSPISRKSSFHDRNESFSRESFSPERRKTPVHMRAIDRTRSKPPARRDTLSDGHNLPGYRQRRSRSPQPPGNSRTRRSHSPTLRGSQSDRIRVFKRESMSPVERRRTPVHLRSIDRTRPTSPRRGFLSDKHSLPAYRKSASRSPETSLLQKRRIHRLLSPADSTRRPISISRPPLSRHRLPSSPPESRSPSPVHVSFRNRLSRPPDKNNPGLLALNMAPGHPHFDSVSPHKTPTLNYEKTQPLTPAEARLIKPEPDIEDFAAVLHFSPPVNVSPSPSPLVQQPDVSSPRAYVSPCPMSDIDETVPRTSPTAETRIISGPVPSPLHAHIVPQQSVPSSPRISPDPLPAPTRSPSPRSPSRSALQPMPLSPSPQPTIAPLPCHNIPGLWFVKVGHDQADIVDCEFEVDAETAHKWHLYGSSISPIPALERLQLQLLCIPKELMQTFYEIGSQPELAQTEALSNALSSLKIAWPQQGSLVVQMNPTKPHRQSWLPNHMGPTSLGLDVTESIREGTNVLRLIQLDNMADKIFMLQAVFPSPSLPVYWDVATFDLSKRLAASNMLPATIDVV